MAEAALATGGTWLAQPLPLDTPLKGGSSDTRAMAGAGIFFALPGGRADGHDFLPRLAGSSARLAVVSREAPFPQFEGNVLRVAGGLEALGRMAAFLVQKHRPRIVAITGSYGKTTAKEVIAHVLAGRHKVLKTPGSHNNELGLPLALLDLDGSQDITVLEFSARREGDIAYLGRIAPPDVAVLLAVGRAHIGVFGSQEAIYRAKGEIFACLKPGGLAVTGAENPRLRELAGEHRTLTFGRDEGDFRAEQVTADARGRQRFTGVHRERRVAFRAGMSGAHGLYPLLAAWAVAGELGVPDQEVAARGEFDPAQKGRSLLRDAPGGALLLDDTYNASPATVNNLIASLASLDGDEKILVLGHLSELEEGLAESAELIGGALTGVLAHCYVYAPASPGLAGRLAGLARACKVREFSTQQELIAALREADRPGKVIGIKGARAAHMERIVQGMLGSEITCELETCELLMSCTDCDEMTRTV
ncbi:MAG: UDP-N-acetylmuramoyl-tripeptide--D-alanyl-D-alanine ligase [SAR324 cluster bacterium]|nr:UDP-N-acetylmuramoyl-tripeptide--D-alanyl-D-alanine ligase [SAR324 cluster bacterium]